MKKIRFTELPDWEFEIDEASVGVYVMTGHDKAGRSVSAQGFEPDALKERCRNDAIDILMKSQATKKP